MTNKIQAIELLLDSNRGIYIPRDFMDMDMDNWQGISEEDKETLKRGPEEEWYWEAWENVLNSATYTQDGHTWRLYQDGDLFALCYDLMTDEEKRNFGFDE